MTFQFQEKQFGRNSIVTPQNNDNLIKDSEHVNVPEDGFVEPWKKSTWAGLGAELPAGLLTNVYMMQPMGERPVFIWKTDSLSFSIRQKTLNSITHKHDKSGNKTEGRITKAVLPVPPQDKNKTRLSGISQGKTQRWRAWSVLLADSVYLKEGSKAKKSLPLGGLTVWFCVASSMVSQNRKFWTFFEIEIGWLIT